MIMHQNVCPLSLRYYGWNFCGVLVGTFAVILVAALSKLPEEE